MESYSGGWGGVHFLGGDQQLGARFLLVLLYLGCEQFLVESETKFHKCISVQANL